jgi:hypothetical protein
MTSRLRELFVQLVLEGYGYIEDFDPGVREVPMIAEGLPPFSIT